jgi:hypothetical protein
VKMDTISFYSPTRKRQNYCMDKHTRKDELKADDEVAAMRPKIDTLANRYVAIIVPSVIDEASFGTREYW